jgi:two-component system response regulator HydG
MISEPAMLRLVGYNWPGNVRELFNVVQRMAVMAGGESIAISHVPEEIRSSESEDASDVGTLAGIGLDKLEKEAIRQTLAMTGGNRENTANLLGIGERTLYRKLKEYGIK